MRLPLPSSSVSCPPDRGDPGYTGRVLEVAERDSHDHRGRAFRWVLVQHPRGTKHLWPSNRLSVA